MSNIKQKAIAAVAAVAVAGATLLGGTLAWQSISQTALNEASDVINPGGRLHDDFNGTNKDVYVENFADDDIYARVKLEEYFEIVMNYGTAAEAVDVVVGERVEADENSENTVEDSDGNKYERKYAVYKFDGNVDENGAVRAALDVGYPVNEGEPTKSWWTWQTGGSTVYMPTFNLNKDSLQADVNGIYEEGNIGAITERFDPDDPQYTEYTEYTDGDTETGEEIYDADANNIEDDGITTIDDVTHIAKTTESGKLMSMQEWINAGSEPGPYWVYDTDGWVYWAQAIPGRNEDGSTNATGLLLDSIELNQVMDDTWYYAINVVAQFVTADDVGKSDGTGFYADGQVPTAEAEALLEAIGVDVDGTGEDGGVVEGWYTDLEEMEAGTAETVSIDGVEWFVLAKDGGKALLQAAQPTEQLTAFAPDNACFLADDIEKFSFDHYLNETEEAELTLDQGYDMLNGGYTTKTVAPLYTVLSSMWDYVEESTYNVFDLATSNGGSTVAYMALNRYAALPTAYDFVGIDPQESSWTRDDAKDHTYNSESLITAEMMEKMLAAATTGKILTRTHDLPHDSTVSAACYDFVTIASDGAGGFNATTTNYAGIETDIFPMLWVNYEQAIADNATGGGSGGEGEYEYTQETMDELNVRTASMDVYRGTQYTITYAYDGDVDSAYLYSVEMSSADGDHLSEVHCDGDEVVITVHPEEPNDTLTLTYTFDYDYSYEVEMTLNVLGDIGGEGEGYLEPTDTLPVINITTEDGVNVASATVYKGEIYAFEGFQYWGMDANVHNDTLELSGGGDEEVRSYVGFDEYGNPLLVIEADEPNDTLLLTGSANMDETFDFTITLTVLDSETGGDDWMLAFTEDPNAAIESFTKYTDLVPDATEYANCLYFAAGTYANEGPDPENITVQIFDKNGTPLTLEVSEGRVTGEHQVQAYAIASVPEGTAAGDKFTGVATWTVDGVTYGIAKEYYWVVD